MVFNSTDVDTIDDHKLGWLTVEAVAAGVFIILLILFGSLFCKARQKKSGGGRV